MSSISWEGLLQVCQNKPALFVVEYNLCDIMVWSQCSMVYCMTSGLYQSVVWFTVWQHGFIISAASFTVWHGFIRCSIVYRVTSSLYHCASWFTFQLKIAISQFFSFLIWSKNNFWIKTSNLIILKINGITELIYEKGVLLQSIF